MLSDQDARLQARKRFAKRAAVAPTKEKDYAGSKRTLRDAEAVLKRR
jgi:hypothetical protein